MNRFRWILAGAFVLAGVLLLGALFAQPIKEAFTAGQVAANQQVQETEAPVVETEEAVTAPEVEIVVEQPAQQQATPEATEEPAATEAPAVATEEPEVAATEEAAEAEPTAEVVADTTETMTDTLELAEDAPTLNAMVEESQAIWDLMTEAGMSVPDSSWLDDPRSARIRLDESEYFDEQAFAGNYPMPAGHVMMAFVPHADVAVDGEQIASFRKDDDESREESIFVYANTTGADQTLTFTNTPLSGFWVKIWDSTYLDKNGLAVNPEVYARWVFSEEGQVGADAGGVKATVRVYVSSDPALAAEQPVTVVYHQETAQLALEPKPLVEIDLDVANSANWERIYHMVTLRLNQSGVSLPETGVFDAPRHIGITHNMVRSYALTGPGTFVMPPYEEDDSTVEVDYDPEALNIVVLENGSFDTFPFHYRGEGAVSGWQNAYGQPADDYMLFAMQYRAYAPAQCPLDSCVDITTVKVTWIKWTIETGVEVETYELPLLTP